MRKYWLCLSFMVLLLQLNAQENHDLHTLDIALMEQRAAASMLDVSRMHSQASASMDVKHFRCHWELDPAVRYIRGRVTASFVSTAPLDSLSLDLVNNLLVDSVLYHGARVAFTRPGNHSVRVGLPASLPQGRFDSITICYQGVPPAGSGFGTFATARHAGIPVLWTLSEPYGSMDWWPCKNGLDDKTDSIDILITTPDTYTGVSNGMLQADITQGGLRTTWWKHRYPIATYLVAIAATNYTALYDSVDLGTHRMPIIQHVYPESATSFKNAATVTARTLQMLQDAFGPYPFSRERYGHTQFSWGGGMEHQTNSFMVNTNETLLVHEAAHQWFGNLVTCGSWRDIWLNEGFAHFCTNYNLERFHPSNTLQSALRSQLNLITAQPGGSVYVDDTTDVRRIFNGRLTYIKGGWILRMLRWSLGDSLFFKGVRRYLEEPATRFGYVRSPDLQAALEAESGRSLDEFFQDWLYGQGYPSFRLTWTPVGNGLLSYSLSQATSHPSVDFFEIPVPVRFWNGTEDTVVVIDHRQQAQSAYLRLAFTPDSASIDPRLDIISAANTVERREFPTPAPFTVNIYPNPVSTECQVFLGNFPEGPLNMVLYNSTGQRLWKEQRARFSGNDIIRLETGDLPAGTYILSVQSGSQQRINRKILK